MLAADKLLLESRIARGAVQLKWKEFGLHHLNLTTCLLFTSDAAAERSSVALGGRRIIKK